MVDLAAEVDRQAAKVREYILDLHILMHRDKVTTDTAAEIGELAAVLAEQDPVPPADRGCLIILPVQHIHILLAAAGTQALVIPILLQPEVVHTVKVVTEVSPVRAALVMAL